MAEASDDQPLNGAGASADGTQPAKDISEQDKPAKKKRRRRKPRRKKVVENIPKVKDSAVDEPALKSDEPFVPQPLDTELEPEPEQIEPEQPEPKQLEPKQLEPEHEPMQSEPQSLEPEPPQVELQSQQPQSYPSWSATTEFAQPTWPSSELEDEPAIDETPASTPPESPMLVETPTPIESSLPTEAPTPTPTPTPTWPASDASEDVADSLPESPPDLPPAREPELELQEIDSAPVSPFIDAEPVDDNGAESFQNAEKKDEGIEDAEYSPQRDEEKQEKMESVEKMDTVEGKDATASEFIEEPVPKEAFADVLIRVVDQIGPFFRRIFDIKFLLVFFVIGGLIWAFTQGYHTKVLELFWGGFSGPVVEDGREDGGSDVPPLQDGILQETGISAALLFGGNQGAFLDLIPVQLYVADLFGRLKEARIGGETGISPATYYGRLLDEALLVNLFAEYVETLAEIQALYSIDVYEMLDRSAERTVVLNQYLLDLGAAEEVSREFLAAMQLHIDDLTISYNSIAGDRDRFEEDFFASLRALEPEKSDILLKSFVDVSQKQIALRARVAALQKLVEYYTGAQVRLIKRIEAVDRNREALIQGIRVVDIPEGRLDIIIREAE